MNTSAEIPVGGGLEVSHLTAITHAVDDQKNRRQQKRKRRKRRQETPEPPPADGTAEDIDAEPDTPTVDYLA